MVNKKQSIKEIIDMRSVITDGFLFCLLAIALLQKRFVPRDPH